MRGRLSFLFLHCAPHEYSPPLRFLTTCVEPLGQTDTRGMPHFIKDPHASGATSLKLFWENTCAAVTDRLCAREWRPYLRIVLARRRFSGAACAKKAALALSRSLARHTRFASDSFEIQVPLHRDSFHGRTEVVLEVGCQCNAQVVLLKERDLPYKDVEVYVIFLYIWMFFL